MPYLCTLTDLQLVRLYNRLYRRMTRGMGYQAFGYDWPTLWANNPGLARSMDTVRAEIRRRFQENGSLAA